MVNVRTASRERPGTAARGWFRLPLLTTAILCLAGFGAVALAVVGHPVSPADLGAERAVQATAWGPLTTGFAWTDWLEGLKQVGLAIAAIVMIAAFNWRAVGLAIWCALSGAVYTGVELLVQRPRPSSSLVHVIRHTNGYSFPSGHVIFFTWLLTLLLLTFGRRLPRPLQVIGWALAALVVAAVAVGRVYTAEHWPSDVLAGLLLGAGWTLAGLSIRRLSRPVLDAD